MKRNKFNAQKTNGYDSRKEARRAEELKLMERAGVISDLEEQPVFELVPKQVGERAVKYVADFQYVEDGETIVEDVKSPVTAKLPAFIIKRKLMKHVHGITVRIT